MAASLKGSSPGGASPAAKLRRPSGCVTGPAPRDGLSRTMVAISTETPSALECCAERAVCGLKFSSVGETGRVSDLLPPVLAIWSTKLAVEWLESAMPGSANPGSPAANAGHSAISPSGRKPAARRVDLTFQCMNSWVHIPAGPIWPPRLVAKPRWCYSNLRDAPLARPVQPVPAFKVA